MSCINDASPRCSFQAAQSTSLNQAIEHAGKTNVNAMLLRSQPVRERARRDNPARTDPRLRPLKGVGQVWCTDSSHGYQFSDDFIHCSNGRVVKALEPSCLATLITGRNGVQFRVGSTTFCFFFVLRFCDWRRQHTSFVFAIYIDQCVLTFI